MVRNDHTPTDYDRSDRKMNPEQPDQTTKAIAIGLQTVVVAVLLGVMAWVGTEIQSLSKTMIGVEGQLRLVTTEVAAQERILRLELQTMENKLVQKIAHNDLRLNDHRTWIDQIWPRLRALASNQEKVKDRLEEIDPQQRKIQLVVPEVK